MPRQIEADETFDDILYEISYTRARLLDEGMPEALTLKPAAWKAKVHEVRELAETIAEEDAAASAAVTGANLASDAECTDFGDDMLLDVGKDRSSPRWRAHFRDKTVSDFNRQPFADQTATIRAWVKESQDPVFVPRRERFDAVATRGERALAADAAVSARRGGLWTKRAELAVFLTQERDMLRDELAAIARTRGLPRSWPETFFRVKRVAAKGGGGGGSSGDGGSGGGGGGGSGGGGAPTS